MDQRPTSTQYKRLRQQRLIAEENAQLQLVRNARRRTTHHSRRSSQENDNQSRHGGNVWQEGHHTNDMLPQSVTALNDITNRENFYVQSSSTSNQNSREILIPNTETVTTQCNVSHRATFESYLRATNNVSQPRNIGESSTSNILPQNPPNGNTNPRRTTTRQRVYQRCAINYHEQNGIPSLQLSPPKTCIHCEARLFHHETSELCCMSGKISVPMPPVPADLLDLYTDQTETGTHFRSNIRKYNHLFAFTSMGVHLDESLANARDGVYSFRAQGSIYHRIGGFLPSNPTSRPRFLQLYIYDTDHELEHRLSENSTLRSDIIEKLKKILDRDNPFVHQLRHLAQRDDLLHCRLLIREQPSDRPQYCLPTASQVAGVIIGGDEVANLNPRDIVVQSTTGDLINVADTAGYYDPLQYPLLFPCGSYGWSINCRATNGRTMPCRAFYAFMFQIRQEPSLIIRSGRLLQQYAVENFVKNEANKLRWVRDNQSTLRAELYQGLQDSWNAGERNPENLGKRCILPSSLVGCARDMNQRYQDAMALVQEYGKPDLFLTMTCNSSWKEIENELLEGQTPQDRPDLCTRIFHAKLEELKRDIIEKGVLGKVIAYVYVVEFQKRGLPHVHMLLILDENDKPRSSEEYDAIIRAEIPDKEEEPELYNSVLKHMIHGPCGPGRRNSSCMVDGICKRKFPKSFSSTTVQGADSYPIYQRREEALVPLHENSRTYVDNSWVVPYNPWLLLKYNCHINVEICSSIKAVKYLYKYVYNGVDQTSMEVRGGEDYNEIKQFLDARWVYAPEALWRLY